MARARSQSSQGSQGSQESQGSQMDASQTQSQVAEMETTGRVSPPVVLLGDDDDSDDDFEFMASEPQQATQQYNATERATENAAEVATEDAEGTTQPAQPIAAGWKHTKHRPFDMLAAIFLCADFMQGTEEEKLLLMSYQHTFMLMYINLSMVFDYLPKDVYANNRVAPKRKNGVFNRFFNRFFKKSKRK